MTKPKSEEPKDGEKNPFALLKEIGAMIGEEKITLTAALMGTKTVILETPSFITNNNWAIKKSHLSNPEFIEELKKNERIQFHKKDTDSGILNNMPTDPKEVIMWTKSKVEADRKHASNKKDVVFVSDDGDHIFIRKEYADGLGLEVAFAPAGRPRRLANHADINEATIIICAC